MAQFGTDKRMGMAAPFAALLLAGLPAAADAQSVNDFQLPSGKQSAAPAPGPVDTDAPVVRVPRRQRAAPPPQPAAQQSPAAAQPSPVASPRAAASPAPHASASPAARPSPPSRVDERAPVPSIEEPSVPPVPTESPAPLPRASAEPTIVETATPAPAPSASLAPANVQPIARTGSWAAYWPWVVGVVAVLLALAAWTRRRRPTAAQYSYEDEEAATAPAAEAPSPPPVVRPLPHAPAPASPLPVPEIGRQPAPVELALEAQRMSATLLNTTLSYTLSVTNTSGQTLGPIAIMCDLSSAHSSLPPKLQLEVGTQVTEPSHRLRALQPGETATLKGELKLPLTDVLTIQAGRKALFVPLARFRVEAWRNNRPQVFRRAFVIGQVPADPKAALKPFRLDLGPRLYSRVGQRELAIA